MRYVGAHVSIAGGVQRAPERAMELDATALGMFTKNQRQWVSRPLADEEVDAFRVSLSRSGIAPEHVVVHASYLINVGNRTRASASDRARRSWTNASAPSGSVSRW